MFNDLKYNFHDSVVIKCDYFPTGDFVVLVQLYEIFYPKKQNIRLTFSGIFNPGKIAKLSRLLNEDSLESDWIGSRINTLKFDDKINSKDFDLYFFLDIDGFDPIRIHCNKILIENDGM